MESRERLLTALDHREPDRVPIDLGGIVTGITSVAHANLRQYLKISGEEIIIDVIQQLVKPEEEILERFGVDTRYVYLGGSRDHQNTPLLGESYVDEWGIERRRAHLHTGGSYYDIVSSPLKEATLEDLKKREWPDPYEPSRVEGLREEAKRLYEEEKSAVIVNMIGSIFEFTWYLRGYMELMMDLLSNKRMAAYLMDKMLEFQLGLFDMALKEAGPYMDVVMVGDDISTQNAPAISLELYREMIKPRQRELYDFIKSKTEAKLFYHSCGSTRSFLPDLIDIGVDIINPVQVFAADMRPLELKREFGRDLVFWGGIDTQRVLPFGGPKEVKEEVKRRIEELAKGGGYVLNAVHNIQSDVPPENIVAMFEAAQEYGVY